MSSSPTFDVRGPLPTNPAGAVAFEASPPSRAVSRTPTLAIPPSKQQQPGKEEVELAIVYPSKGRRYLLLVLFALAQFLDIVSASGVVVGIDAIALELGMTYGEATWIVNAYALTLASFLLTGGRLADMFSAKWTFTVGFAWVGGFSLGIGFVRDKNLFIVLRSLQGIGAGLTIPAALRMIVMFFPPEEREVAIAVFGASGALANILGVVLGGVLLIASWDWIFYFIAIICLPLAAVSAVFTPSTAGAQDLAGRKPKFDYLGTFLMIASFVLVIYGATEGNVGGWSTAKALAPMLVGAALFPTFLWWETRMDPFDALIDPKIWRIRNVVLISVISLLPYFWWFLVEVTYAQVMQTVWGNSAVLTGAKFLPIGIAGGVVAALSGSMPLTFPLKWRFVIGCIGSAAGALMYAFADGSNDYWRLIFPASIIGSAATALTFVTANIALMMSIPHEYAGVAGGIFNSSLQLGVVIGLSIATAIQVSFPAVEGQPMPRWKGFQSAFFFLMSSMLLGIILILVFFEDPIKVRSEEEATDERKPPPSVSLA